MTVPQACAYWNQAEKALWQSLDPVPIAYRPKAWFLHRAEAEITGFRVPVPTSLRVLK